MILKYAGECSRCGRTIPKGAQADYQPATKSIAHYNCPSEGEETPEQIARRLNFVGLGEEETVEWSKLRYEVSG